MGSCCCCCGPVKDEDKCRVVSSNSSGGKVQVKQKVRSKSRVAERSQVPKSKLTGGKLWNKKMQLSSSSKTGGSPFTSKFSSGSGGAASSSHHGSSQCVSVRSRPISSKVISASGGSKVPASKALGMVDGNSSSQKSSVSSKESSPADASVIIASLAKLNFSFRDDRTSALFAETAAQQMAALKNTRLYGDQSLTETTTGEKVNKHTTRKLMTQKVLNRIRADQDSVSPEVRTILAPPFSSLDLIVPGVYLAGFYGMIEESIKNENISLIINATNELPLYKKKTIISCRIPVVDSDQEPIGLYFDDVADLMELNRRMRGNSVVHCMAGVSRSSTVLLAYLVKYTSLTLHEAFVHCKSVRPCIRPNMGFIRQLIEYESKLNGQSSTKMVVCEHKETNRKATVPDFYPSQCPDLFLIELDRQNKRSIQ